MTKSRLDSVLYVIGLAVAVWALITFLIQPLAVSLQTALFQDGGLAFTSLFGELSGSARVRKALTNTIWMTAATLVTVTIVGIFQVAVLEYFHVRGRGLLKLAFATPLVFGGTIAAAGYNFTYGPSGVLTQGLRVFFPGLPYDWFIGWLGVLYAHTFLMTSFYFLFLRAAMRRVDYSTVEAARSMGAGEFTILRRVVLPVILPTLLAVALLTVYTAIGSFAVPEILGGRDFYMLSQVTLTLNSLRRPDLAALLALLLGVIVMVLILLSQYFENRGMYVGGSKATTPIQLRRIRNPVMNAIIHLLSYVLVAIYLVPVLLVVVFSFAPASSIGVEMFPSTFTLSNYIHVLSGGAAFEPFLNSMIMGAAAVTVGLALTLFLVPVILKRRNLLTRMLDIGLFLPWLVPSILLAVGFVIAFATPNLLVGNFVLLGNYWLLPIGYTVVALPLMVRFLRAAFVGIDPAYEEAARSMGARGLYRFRRVVFPLVAPTAILVGGLAFNDILTEYPLSAFLYGIDNKPLSIAVVADAMATNPEQKAISLVYVTLVMGFSLMIILLAERVGLGKGPEINRV